MKTAIIFCVLCYVEFAFENNIKEIDDNTLILTHVLFRHGNRTADIHETYPNDPYRNEPYHPFGIGQLTMAGKKKEYSVGKALRNRYQNLLGEVYYPDVIEASTTDYSRTKMSLQLVLAGLFPPRDEDIFGNGILWQPVPFNCLPRDLDKVLLGVLCPRYLEMYEEVSRSKEMIEKFSQYSAEFKYISEHAGFNATRFIDAFNLYFGLSTEEEWGFKLPDWTKIVWPETITKLAIQDYFVSMATQEMQQMATGYFINKIIEDTKNKIISSNKPGKKMYLYSAHETNIAELLIGLDLFDVPHVPNYGAWVSMEVHFVNDVYGIKIYYEDHSGFGPQLLTLPNCGSFCPLDKFITLTKKLIPKDELCGI